MPEQVFVATPAVGGGGRVIASPFQFLFTGEDNLRLVIVNSQPGVVVQLDYRFLGQGVPTPQVSAPTFAPTADRMPNVFDFSIGTGFLLNCSLVVKSGAPLVGQTYVMVQIIRGLGGATVVIGALLGGYVTASQHVAYPGSVIESSIAGGGYPRTIVGTTPGAGLALAETVPTGARWQLLTGWFNFTTDGVAGNRLVNLQLAHGGIRSYISPPPAGQAAGIVGTYSFGAGLLSVFEATQRFYTLPTPNDTVLLAGDQFGTTTAGLDAGDQFSNLQYSVREWLEAA